MNKIKDFYNSFGFIITFMFLTVLISALFGQKFLNKFLLLVLASQLLLNSDEAIELINKFNLSNDKVNNTNNTNNNKNTTYSGDVINGKIAVKYLDANNKIVTEYVNTNDGKLKTNIIDKDNSNNDGKLKTTIIDNPNNKLVTKYIY